MKISFSFAGREWLAQKKNERKVRPVRGECEGAKSRYEKGREGWRRAKINVDSGFCPLYFFPPLSKRKRGILYASIFTSSARLNLIPGISHDAEKKKKFAAHQRQKVRDIFFAPLPPNSHPFTTRL